MMLRLTLLFAIAWVISTLLRKRSASLRHLVWLLAIAGSLLLPALEWRIPQQVIQRQLPSVVWVVADAVAPAQASGHSSYFPALWILGAACLVGRGILNRIRLHRVVSSARTIYRMGPIDVRISGRIQGPGVCGIWRPAILVPEEAACWTLSVKRAVFTHEVAHIRRRDTLTLFIAEAARAVYWFHPLTWLACSELRKESEKACDDAAIRVGLRPSSYAGQLLKLAHAFSLQPAIPMATTSHLESRMKAILDPQVKRNTVALRTWLFAVLATAAIMVPLSSLSLQAKNAEQADQAAKSKLDAEQNQQAKWQAEHAAMQGAPGAIRVGGNVQEANIISKAVPVYPPAAKERRSQGSVILDVVVGKDGVPTNVESKPTDVDPDLVASAIEAVRQWRYKPTLLNGEPVDVITTVTVNFTLTQ